MLICINLKTCFPALKYFFPEYIKIIVDEIKIPVQYTPDLYPK